MIEITDAEAAKNLLEEKTCYYCILGVICSYTEEKGTCEHWAADSIKKLMKDTEKKLESF
jgi:hypothetical protein